MEEKENKLKKEQEEIKTKKVEEANTKEKVEKVEEVKKESTKKKKSKLRMGLVLLFLIIFAGITYVLLRGSYLEYLELGENFTDVFQTNLTYKLAIMGINFVILYFLIYLTNRGIKKGLTDFFLFFF